MCHIPGRQHGHPGLTPRPSSCMMCHIAGRATRTHEVKVMAYEVLDPLTDEQVVEIRRLANVEGWKYGRIARQFKRTVGTIGRIVRGETHQHVGMVKKMDAEFAAQIAESERRMLQTLEKTPVDIEREQLAELLKPKRENPYK